MKRNGVLPLLMFLPFHAFSSSLPSSYSSSSNTTSYPIFSPPPLLLILLLLIFPSSSFLSLLYPHLSPSKSSSPQPTPPLISTHLPLLSFSSPFILHAPPPPIFSFPSHTPPSPPPPPSSPSSLLTQLSLSLLLSHSSSSPLVFLLLLSTLLTPTLFFSFSSSFSLHYHIPSSFCFSPPLSSPELSLPLLLLLPSLTHLFTSSLLHLPSSQLPLLLSSSFHRLIFLLPSSFTTSTPPLHSSSPTPLLSFFILYPPLTPSPYPFSFFLPPLSTILPPVPSLLHQLLLSSIPPLPPSLPPSPFLLQ